MANNIILLDSEQVPVLYSDDEDLPNFEIKLSFPQLPEADREIETEEVADCQDEDSSQEIDNFIVSEKSENTVKKTQSDWKKFEQFCMAKTSGNFNINNIPGKDLDKLLCLFFRDVRKKDGGEYEPDTVSSFQKSIHRHLGQVIKAPFNILKDDTFSRSREVLVAKRKNLVKQGKGNKPNATRELTDQEEEKLFESGEFGQDNPLTLQRTLWWFLSMNFGFRARDESRKLCWGDVKLEVDPQTGREVLVWAAERGSKTRPGLEGGHQRQFDPKIFATGTTRCPVLLYKIFDSHRPQKFKTPQSPFFLAVNQNWQKNYVWYKNSPLGKNTIGKFLSQAARSAGLPQKSKKLANHSVRKTSISRLLDSGTPENFVCQLSGHKNLQSLSSYKSASISHQQFMSDALTRASVNQDRAKIVCTQQSSTATASSIENQTTTTRSPFSELYPGQSLFSGATIGSIYNCVFNMNPTPEFSCDTAKRQRIDQ